MQPSLSDEEMIRHYRLSQPTHCFETLYNRYVSKVYQRCLYMTKDAEQAQDFTHDIFMKVFAKLDGFQERSSFSTWLNTIAFNYCADQLRLSKRLLTTNLDENLAQRLSDSRDVVRPEEVLQVFQREFANLPLREQTLLRLKYEQGLGIEEIAQIYKLKPSAVKMRLKRSREKLQQLCVQKLDD